MVWFFGWFLIGIIGAAIGSRKGRPVAGFLYSFLLGPLGLLLTLVIGPAKSHKCPHCGGLINPNYSRCKNCGAEITRSSESFLSRWQL